MPQLYLIRHGQSENNARAGESTRTADPGLTHTGQVQAVRVASHLTREVDRTDVRDGFVTEGGYRIGRLFCSPMLRALQTAQPIGEALACLRKSGWTPMKAAASGSIGRTGVAGWATVA